MPALWKYKNYRLWRHFDCPVCQLEFEKRDFNAIKDKGNILSIEEKFGITNELKKKNMR